MRKITTLFILLKCVCQLAIAQQSGVQSYSQATYMIPMRDGVKLNTIIYSPVGLAIPVPLLLYRTPYGADRPNVFYPLKQPYFEAMAKEGYIFVIQDMRGKFKSEGSFEMDRPIYHFWDKKKTDESTDAYDTVDWLVKHIANNNGKAGILGISYSGTMALQAISDPHPALKASSPQAAPADMFLGDDEHHNGAFRLAYNFEYSYYVENAKEQNSTFPFAQYDLYDWFLKLGPLANVNKLYFHNRLPAWNTLVDHPNYDQHYKTISQLTPIHYPPIPVLHVGGYYDQEDLNGPQLMYAHLEKKDSLNRNYIVLGPWNHGGWIDPKGDSLGKINFESNTAPYFRNLQKAWFDYWLKGIGSGKFAEATCFQTGTNTWKTYTAWPPKEAVRKKLYVQADGSCSFEKPKAITSIISYISDPAKPVPYRTQPIEPFQDKGSRWAIWQVEDQRFVSSRPDVLSFVSDSVQTLLTVAGDVKAHLLMSTSGTDADFVVKLIDVYPNVDSKNVSMSGYQFPVAMEVFRGRFRKSFEKPEPFTPNRPTEIVIDLHQINHTFLRGHKLMVQIQSTWFPLIDRNPQKYVPTIFEAKEGDFIKATQTIYCNRQLSTYIDLPIVTN